MGGWILAAIFWPLAAGFLVAFWPLLNEDRKHRNAFTGSALLLQCALVIAAVLSGDQSFVLFSITREIPIAFRSDELSRVFSLLMNAMWTVSGFFSFSYMAHAKEERRYYAFYLMSLSALNALCFADTLITMYLFYEMLTLETLAMVLHERSPEAISASIKYLIYSVAGATLGLMGIFFLTPNLSSVFFKAGGALVQGPLTLPRESLLILSFLAMIGFGTKAGMFPMHGWLPTAHPVAPAPASAVLSGVITKAGVLCTIRFLFYSLGPDFIRGTWVQTLLLSFAALTVFMGSMLALNEKLLKKRLAYSSISQVSYVLCGLFLLDRTALNGALLHIVFHALIKDGLFLCAGAIIFQSGFTQTEDLRGIGKKMPLTMGCFTVLSLGLVGIPPTGGFISKWYIAQGAIASGQSLPVFSWLIPVVLLVSALLTAAYLLPPCVNAFFSDPQEGKRADFGEVDTMMKVPMLLFALAVLVLGIAPGGMIEAFAKIANSLI